MRIPDVADLSRGYDIYYSTGLYQNRYPRPNADVLARVVRLIGIGGKRVLDFGCGDGRYAAPLIERTDAHLIAYDISPVGVRILGERCQAAVAAGRLTLLAGEFDLLPPVVATGAPLDLALLLFGVITHIRPRSARIKTLAAIRALMRPGGKLVLTAANRARRFAAEQAAVADEVAAGRLEPGDIIYHRGQGDRRIDLYLHLYERAEFVADLQAAGFRILELAPESVLPEAAVVASRGAVLLDRALKAMLPVDRAFDFLAVCEPEV